MFDFNLNGELDIVDLAILSEMLDEEERTEKKSRGFDDIDYDDDEDDDEVDEADIIEYLYDDYGSEIGYIYINEFEEEKRHFYDPADADDYDYGNDEDEDDDWRQK